MVTLHNQYNVFCPNSGMNLVKRTEDKDHQPLKKEIRNDWRTNMT